MYQNNKGVKINIGIQNELVSREIWIFPTFVHLPILITVATTKGIKEIEESTYVVKRSGDCS